MSRINIHSQRLRSIMLKMNLKPVAIALFTTILTIPTLVQAQTPTKVQFKNFSFSFDSTIAQNVDIKQIAGDPKDLEQPGGPEAPHDEFVLYTGDTAPASYTAPAVIRVYRTVDFNGYTFQTEELTQLKELLKTHPDLSSTMIAGTSSETSLPFLPVFPAAQVIRSQVDYVNTSSLSGIHFVTVFRQDVSPFTSAEFIYTFQGISNDGSTYVSAIFPLNISLFPATIPDNFNYDEFQKGFDAYLADSIAKINNAKPEEIAPNLASLDAIIGSFELSK